MESNTILHYIERNAFENPLGIAFTFLNETGEKANELTNEALWQEVRAVATYLASFAEKGSRILLFYPPGLEYITSFYGCLLAEMIAVPLYPPRKSTKSDRLVKVCESCHSTLALVAEAESENLKRIWAQQNTDNLPLEFHVLTNNSALELKAFDLARFNPADVAFLQYTSGSTGVPKGVMITHGNILGNTESLTLTNNANGDDIFVNWLPLFHDMGLVCTLLWPVYLGVQSVMMAPATFVRNPLIWLQSINRYRGSVCGAPNFAYDLCVNRIDESELQDIDLSCWKVAFNSAEPVRAETLKNFSRKFGECGYSHAAFYPGYGMAEATVFISGGTREDGPTLLSVDKRELAENKLVIDDSANDSSVDVVSCGRALSPHSLKIVEPNTKEELPEGCVGEIWFSGPSLSPGYWDLATISKEVFGQSIVNAGTEDATYFRTGDLGSVVKGELFVTGRMKDVIIVHGKNYYPQDIEHSSVTSHEALRPGYCAAFSVDSNGIEKLVVAAEVDRKFVRKIDFDEVCSAVRQAVFDDHSLSVEEVILLKPNRIPVTSSGKIQRAATKALYVKGELEIMSTGTPAVVVEEVLTEVESAISAIWKGVLNLDCLGLHDNFFDRGGNSLSAIEIASKIKKAYSEVCFSHEELLEMPTVAKMAEYIQLKSDYVVRSNQRAEATSGKVIMI